MHLDALSKVVRLKLLSDGSCSAIVPGDAQKIPGRLQALLPVGRAALSCSGLKTVTMQFHDENPGEPCLGFDSSWMSDRSLLIPDPYCLLSNGFKTILEDFENYPLPSWRQRQPIFFWRGSTTGAKALTVTRMKSLPRYQLCATTNKLSSCVDAYFTDVVQARDSKAQTEIRHWLKDQNLFSDRVAPRTFGEQRWLIDIDGNVNSWGLLWKLFSGSCILRVSSSRQQWFHHRLVPYQHFVPVASDLHDLEAQVAWCQNNLDTCEAIAASGCELALDIIAEQGLDLVAALRNWKQLSDRS